MKLSQSWIYPVTMVFMVVLLLWPRFGAVMQHPNGYLFADRGDALKNYFVFAYYLKHDSGLTFSGLNYPYGENLLFTDSHPLYALLLNWIDDNIIEVSAYPVAIINLSILLGFILGAVFLYLIQKEFGLPSIYAALVSLCILFLSPQIHRLQGHLSLSYVFVIPYYWWVMIKASQKNSSVGWYILMGISAFIFTGIHAYYGGILASFTLAFVLMQWFAADRSDFWRKHIGFIIAGTLPLILFFIWSKITDEVSDRPISPYGFYVYHANLASIFLPHHDAISQVVREVIAPRINWEGRAFIGTIPAVMVFTYLVNILFTRRAFLRMKRFKPWVPAAGVVLLFSMCIPFEWGLQFITDLVKPLKQFRALGRFSWVFYYVIGVTTAYYLYQLYAWLKERAGHLAAVITVAVALLIWGFDAAAFYLGHSKKVWPQNHTLSNNSDAYLKELRDRRIDPNDFQAIMSLPLVSIRTDKMVFNRDFSGYEASMQCAFHTGLPIIQSSASRPSLSQSYSNIQLISDPRIEKVRTRDFKDTKPLLLITGNASSFTDGESSLIASAEKLYAGPDATYWKLPLTAFAVDDKRTFSTASLQLQDDFVRMYHDTSDLVYYQGFHELESTATFRSPGAKYAHRGPLNVFSGEIEHADSQVIEISFWLYIDPSYDGMPVLFYKHGVDQTAAQTERIDIRTIPDLVGDWVLVRIHASEDTWHNLTLQGRDITVDELLIRPLDREVQVIYADQEVSINNFPIGHKSK